MPNFNHCKKMDWRCTETAVLTPRARVHVYEGRARMVYCLCLDTEDGELQHALSSVDGYLVDVNGNFPRPLSSDVRAEWLAGIRFICRRWGQWIDLDLRQHWDGSTYSYYLSDSYHRLEAEWEALRRWNRRRMRSYVHRWRSQLAQRREQLRAVVATLYDHTPFDPHVITAILARTREYAEWSIGAALEKHMERKTVTKDAH